MFKNSKILVTGSAGLVGSALCERLIADGYENVIGLSRTECDLLDTAATKKYFYNQAPDYVFHCAARVYGILGNMNNKGISFYENVLMNTNVVEASRYVGVKKIVAMGTGAVYPYPSPGLPLNEDMIFMGVPHIAEDSYAHAKRAMLAMLRAYEESYGLSWAYVVSCNLFGAKDKFDTVNGHVVPSLVKKFYDAKLNDANVVVWGNGSAKRDFMYVKDAASALISIMNKATGAINLGGGVVYSIKQIVDYLATTAGMHTRVEWDSLKPNGQDYRAYDLSKLKATGFRCEYSIEDGLRETWDWYVENN
ncbi:MAG: hypothetical protein B7X60_02885 [Polynucleobacter sp. 39-45-136]|jgi:GDP-L-fucose synthase|nr:MAG: hypothetical protein B7X60_02885 [Polynucleobacter sp. 39-45-136]